MLISTKIAKLDRSVLFLTTCLVGMGTVAIYEATTDTRLDGLYISYLYLFALFCLPMLFIALVDYKILLGRLAYLFYGVGIGLLVLVKLVGENLNGAVRWLSIGSFQLQPSELAKICTVLLIAHLLGTREGQRLRFFQDLVPVCFVFNSFHFNNGSARFGYSTRICWHIT